MADDPQTPVLRWKVDECSVYFGRLHLRGWCFHPGAPIIRVEAIVPGSPAPFLLASFGLESPDVAGGVHPSATRCRFDDWLPFPAAALGRDFNLRITLEGGAAVDSGSVLANAAQGDPYFRCWDIFIEHLREIPSGAVLEIGSRARSAINYRGLIPAALDYVGMDILPGPNVDVVGDAHDLERLFGRNRFVAAFSSSVFEHLAMPWKAAVELNRVLVPGGLVFTATHQTWPLHELPWDFWRFSEHTWQTIFNAASGFRVIETASGEPARIHATRANPATRGLQESQAFLGSASIVRKVAETSLSWPVPLASAAPGEYPPGELQSPPR